MMGYDYQVWRASTLSSVCVCARVCVCSILHALLWSILHILVVFV